MRQRKVEVVVFHPNGQQVLLCNGQRPFSGLLDLVGGRVEEGEDTLEAAYRLLWERTGISRREILLFPLLEIRYHLPQEELSVYMGKLEKEEVLLEKLEKADISGGKKNLPLQEPWKETVGHKDGTGESLGEGGGLSWLSLKEDFADQARFAGEGSLAHILGVAGRYPLPERSLTQDGVYIGVDGCRGGWIGAILDYGELRFERYDSLEELLKTYQSFQAFLIDMAIGLRSNASQIRPDEEAKRELGKRGSSVFPIPCRQAVYAKGEEEQKETNKRILGKSLSKQTLNILPKIREVDEVLEKYPQYRNQILESHPELDFYRLSGGELLPKKKEALGIQKRISILEEYLGLSLYTEVKGQAERLCCALDDLLDALCLSLTAALAFHGQCETLPEAPEKDERGLFMKLTAPLKRNTFKK